MILDLSHIELIQPGYTFKIYPDSVMWIVVLIK